MKMKVFHSGTFPSDAPTGPAIPLWWAGLGDGCSDDSSAGVRIESSFARDICELRKPLPASRRVYLRANIDGKRSKAVSSRAETIRLDSRWKFLDRIS
jgi:hypothetical protein